MAAADLRRRAVHEVDLAGLLQASGVFASIRDDRDVYEAVTVDREVGTVIWRGEVDLDSDVLRGDQPPASTSRPGRLTPFPPNPGLPATAPAAERFPEPA